MYNFDNVIDRRNTHSAKHDTVLERNFPADILPMWIADMEFPVPKEVVDAVMKAASQEIYGYTSVTPDYFKALKDWYGRRFGWELKEEWLVRTPGVIFGVSAALRYLTKPGDAVIIQRPVYYPFSDSIETNGRRIVDSPLIFKDGAYHMDFETFEKKITDNDVKVCILCNPHNPVGRVWSKEELIKMGDICMKHNVFVIADEMHADFINKGYKHFVFPELKPEYADHCMVCTSPSKTFNMPGLQVSNIFIMNKEVRNGVKAEIKKTSYGELNLMGIVACQAAYAYGETWFEELKAYLADNLDFMREYLKVNIPKIKLIEPQGTYLIWIDCRELGLTPQELDKFMIYKAKLWLDDGAMFGECGGGFQRVNIACPRSILKEALDRLKAAVDLL